MNPNEQENTLIYKVVVNDAAEHSLWPADRENQLGWTERAKAAPDKSVWITSERSGKTSVLDSPE